MQSAPTGFTHRKGRCVLNYFVQTARHKGKLFKACLLAKTFPVENVLSFSAYLGTALVTQRLSRTINCGYGKTDHLPNLRLA